MQIAETIALSPALRELGLAQDAFILVIIT